MAYKLNIPITCDLVKAKNFLNPTRVSLYLKGYPSKGYPSSINTTQQHNKKPYPTCFEPATSKPLNPLRWCSTLLILQTCLSFNICGWKFQRVGKNADICRWNKGC